MKRQKQPTRNGMSTYLLAPFVWRLAFVPSKWLGFGGDSDDWNLLVPLLTALLNLVKSKRMRD